MFVQRTLNNTTGLGKGRTMRKGTLGAFALTVGMMVGCGSLAGGASARVPVPPRPEEITGVPGHGCPYGAVCIYPRARTFKTGPEKNGIFYSYGAHNLHHQFRYHLVYNNQYNVSGVDAGFSLCLGHNGHGGWFNMIRGMRGWWAPMYLTNVNSITLWLYNFRYYRLANC